MKRNGICALVALMMAFLLTGMLVKERGILVEVRAQEAQRTLAEEVLRFHVLANSDSERDQELKLQVKEGVLSYMKEQMPEGMTLAETKQWVQEHLLDIEKTAERILVQQDCEDAVTAKLETVMFPKKTYGDVTFPAGEYEALRIEIGKAEGQNWWCCLYPNLCFIDAVHAVVPEEGKQELQNVLDDDSFEMVTTNTDFKIKWFFFR